MQSLREDDVPSQTELALGSLCLGARRSRAEVALARCPLEGDRLNSLHSPAPCLCAR